MGPPRHHSASLPLALMFLALAAAVVGVPLLLSDAAARTSAFWMRIGWTLVLLAMIWGVLSGFVTRIVRVATRAPSAQGAAPSGFFVIGSYAAASFAAMIGHAALGGSPLANRLHLAIQLVLGVAAVGLLAALSTAQRLQRSGSPSRTDVHSRDAIVQRVRVTESRLEAMHQVSPRVELTSLLQALRGLRDRLDRGLRPRTASDQHENFGWLAGRVDSVCRKFDGVGTTPLSADAAADMMADSLPKQ